MKPPPDPELDDGIYFDMPREEYDALKARVNWSTLKHLKRSPAHYQHAIGQPNNDTPARARGRAVHLAVLEPEKFLTTYAAYGGRRAGKAWEAFEQLATKAGREVLKEDVVEEIDAIVKAVKASDQARPLLTGGRSEVTVLWTHRAPAVEGLPGFEIRCRARLDYVTAAALADLKSTRDADPSGGWQREAWTYQMHVQAAWYSDAWLAITGKRLPYYLVAVEAFAPYVVQAYLIDDRELTMGRETYRDLIARLHFCRTNNAWPGYADSPMALELPRWAYPRDDFD